MKKSDAIRLRKQVIALAQKGHSVSEISRRLGVSRFFVRTWKDAKDPVSDERGWTKGKKRKYTEEQEQRILAARDTAEGEFFSVHMHWRTNSMMQSRSTSSSAHSVPTDAPNRTAEKRKEDQNTCSIPSVSSMRSERL